MWCKGLAFLFMDDTDLQEKPKQTKSTSPGLQCSSLVDVPRGGALNNMGGTFQDTRIRQASAHKLNLKQA